MKKYIAFSICVAICSATFSQPITKLTPDETYKIADLEPKTQEQVCKKITTIYSGLVGVKLMSMYPNGQAFKTLWDNGNGEFIKSNYRSNECVIYVSVKGTVKGNSYNNTFSCGVEKVTMNKDKNFYASDFSANCTAL